MPGPAPKPAAIKKREGTHRKDREAPSALDFVTLSGVPDPPTGLTEEASQCWRVTAAALHVNGLLAAVDLALLRAYCYHVGQMQEAERELADKGKIITITNKGGGSYETKSPWITILNESTAFVLKIGQQFGFSPASRTRISAPTKKESEHDPWQGM